MRLTTYHRAAILKAALNDVPQVDYEQLARDAAMKVAVAMLPSDVRAIWKKYGTSTIFTDNIWLERCGIVHMKLPYLSGEHKKLEKTAREAVEEIHQLHLAQVKQMEELKVGLYGALVAITTIKALKAQLPELAKYAPTEPERSSNLPAIANVMANLMKAGWPKPAQQAGA